MCVCVWNELQADSQVNNLTDPDSDSAPTSVPIPRSVSVSVSVLMPLSVLSRGSES